MIINRPLSKSEDLVTIIQNLRPADLRELQASSGVHPMTALVKSITGSLWTDVLFHSVTKEVAVIYGLAQNPLNDKIGIPWAVATNSALEYPVAVLRNIKGILKRMHRQFPILGNVVDVRNETHIKWLWVNGFEIHWDKAIKLNGFEFIPFTRVRRVKNV